MKTTANSSTKIFPYNELPLPWKPPDWSAQFKTCAEDFVVDEKLSFNLDEVDNSAENNSYEHLYVRIEKKNLNTLAIVSFLTDYFQVATEDIHFAGLKDKHAITRQWFSIRLPGQKRKIDTALLKNFNLYRYVNPCSRHNSSLKTQLLSHPGQIKVECKILEAIWHSVALKRGAISENQFSIVLRGLGAVNAEVLAMMQQLKHSGFANYYGLQRFGHNGRNLQNARSWFNGDIQVDKPQQSLLISSARSFLFNQILANRVLDNCWNVLKPADNVQCNRGQRFFKFDQSDADIQSKIDLGECNPAVALFRREEIGKGNDNATIASSVYKLTPELSNGLAKLSFNHRVRPLRVMPGNFSWTIEHQQNLLLKFSLPSGSYATTLIQQLGDIQHRY